MYRLVIVAPNLSLRDTLTTTLHADYQLEPLSELSALEEQLNTHPTITAVMVDAGLLEQKNLVEFEHLNTLANQRSIPIIVLSGGSSPTLQLQALEIGCADFITAPFLSPVIESKLRPYIQLQTLQNQVTAQNTKIQHAVDEIAVVQDAAILCLAAIARVRDHSTGNHILRTQHYVKVLAEHLHHHPRFKAELDHNTIELLYKSAALHDIGKVAVPDSILLKPDALTDDEYTEMKKHTLFGYQAIHTAETLLEHDAGVQASRFLKIAQQVTLSHHERWDGKGYPQGLKGEQIPVVARLMAVADVYDAVSSRRPYKAAYQHSHVVKIISESRGTHFDPDIVDAFMDLQDVFKQISGVLEDRFPSLSDLTLHSLDSLLPDVE